MESESEADNDIDLMRTILGEHVPKSVILTCLHTCAFDVSDAINYYFMEVAPLQQVNENVANISSSSTSSKQLNESKRSYSTFIHSGLRLNLHARYLSGTIGKIKGCNAHLTAGSGVYEVLTPNNDKNSSIILRKRLWKKMGGMKPVPPDLLPNPSFMKKSAVADFHFPYLMNGDVVTLECDGLWLRPIGQLYSNRKMLQWKQPSDDDRSKFVIRGLPLGRYLRPGEYFFLTSYKWKDKELVLRAERPSGAGTFDQNRYFLSMERIKTYESASFVVVVSKINGLTDNASESIAIDGDPIDASKLVIMTGSPRRSNTSLGRLVRSSCTSEMISEIDAKIDQMTNITGPDVSRDVLSVYLDGAGGNVQVALEHYFMAQPIDVDRRNERIGTRQLSKQSIAPSLPTRDTDFAEAGAVAATQAKAKAEAIAAQIHHESHIGRPHNELLIPIPSISETFSASVSSENKHVKKSQGSDRLRDEESLHSNLALARLEETEELETKISSNSGASNLLVSTDHEPSTGSRSSEVRFDADSSEQQNEVEALSIQDFEMLSVLGKGSFAAVILVRFKKDGRIFAIKILKKTNMDSADKVNAMEERQILQRIHHPYICGLLFAFQTNERLYLGMKYYAAGDLFYHLNLRGNLNVRDARLYAAELVLAISYLHGLNILYRDLKPSNIMIDDEGHIAVVDFGLSKQHIYGSSSGVRTLSGTAEYVAPEALAQAVDGTREYGKAYDWWSLGVVLYEMLVGESPFYHENEHTMLQRIAREEVVFPADFPKDALELVRGLLCKDPCKRLGCSETHSVDKIKSNPFFASINWNSLARREIKAFWRPKLSGDTDTRYVDPEFTDDAPPSALYDPSVNQKNINSRRFSQFSFNYIF
uniref:Protein kinase putative n=1 Tax=Albugo laibachii Nc14 TaxID=890382 RepID=F0WHB8_9STRA|nr:protein kinase putative [Albugo laibachii Nc14]|eukprot:CCA20634.1 protein kinase putative [Albugo laibachii Nc14]